MNLDTSEKAKQPIVFTSYSDPTVSFLQGRNHPENRTFYSPPEGDRNSSVAVNGSSDGKNSATSGVSNDKILEGKAKHKLQKLQENGSSHSVHLTVADKSDTNKTFIPESIEENQTEDPRTYAEVVKNIGTKHAEAVNKKIKVKGEKVLHQRCFLTPGRAICEKVKQTNVENNAYHLSDRNFTANREVLDSLEDGVLSRVTRENEGSAKCHVDETVKNTGLENLKEFYNFDIAAESSRKESTKDQSLKNEEKEVPNLIFVADCIMSPKIFGGQESVTSEDHEENPSFAEVKTSRKVSAKVELDAVTVNSAQGNSQTLTAQISGLSQNPDAFHCCHQQGATQGGVFCLTESSRAIGQLQPHLPRRHLYDVEIDGKVPDAANDPPGQQSTLQDHHFNPLLGLASFYSWLNDRLTVSSVSLARSGFFYRCNMYRMQLFPHGGILRNWTEADDDMIFSQQELVTAYLCRYSSNPHMRSEAARVYTFDCRWLVNKTRTSPAEIAEARFFFVTNGFSWPRRCRLPSHKTDGRVTDGAEYLSNRQDIFILSDSYRSAKRHFSYTGFGDRAASYQERAIQEQHFHLTEGPAIVGLSQPPPPRRSLSDVEADGKVSDAANDSPGQQSTHIPPGGTCRTQAGSGLSIRPSATPGPTGASGSNIPCQWRMASVVSADHRRYLTNLYLHRELDRLASFSRWPTGRKTVSPVSLAKSGFFYLGDMDRTQCFSCGGVLRNWTEDNDAMTEHRTHFPKCRFVSGAEPRNVKISDQQETPEELATAYPCQYPSNPHMRSEAARVATFDRCWPTDKTCSSPAEIAEAGFFFLGENDRAKCWYCNGGLQNWEYDDTPWIEHSKWFPNCQFLLRRQGQSFVHLHLSQSPHLPRPIIGRQEGSTIDPIDILRGDDIPPTAIIDPQDTITDNRQQKRAKLDPAADPDQTHPRPTIGHTQQTDHHPPAVPRFPLSTLWETQKRKKLEDNQKCRDMSDTEELRKRLRQKLEVALDANDDSVLDELLLLLATVQKNEEEMKKEHEEAMNTKRVLKQPSTAFSAIPSRQTGAEEVTKRLRSVEADAGPINPPADNRVVREELPAGQEGQPAEERVEHQQEAPELQLGEEVYEIYVDVEICLHCTERVDNGHTCRGHEDGRAFGP